MIPEDVVEDGFGVDEVGAEDLVEGGDGAAEVFGDEVGGGAGGQGLARIGQGRGRVPEGFVVADIGNKSRIRVRDQVGFQGGEGRAEFGEAQTGLGGEFQNNYLFIKRCNKIVNGTNIFVNPQIIL